MRAKEYSEMGLRRRRRCGTRRQLFLLLLLLIGLTVLFYKLISDLDPAGGGLTQPKDVTDVNLYRINSFVTNSSQRRSKTGITRTRQYCNSPFEPIHGSEGLVPEGFELRTLHVFIRHGDRTPIYLLPGFRQPLFDCNFKKWYPKVGSSKKLKAFAQKMESFTPNVSIPSAFQRLSLLPDRDVCPHSALTNLGALQHLNLGQFFYDRFHAHSGLFNWNVTTPKLDVRSSLTDRTFQSAMAFVYGFLPEFSDSEFRLHQSQDIYMCVPGSRPCGCARAGKHSRLYHQFLKSAKTSRPEHNDIMAKLTDVLSLKQEHLHNIGRILDAVLPAECHNKGSLCSSRHPGRCIDNKTMDLLWKEDAFPQLLKTLDPNKNLLKYSYLQIYPVLYEISLNTQRVLEDQTAPRFFLYSGHDSTINALRVALDLYDSVWPPYASRVVFEIYESKTHSGKLYMKFLYNGEDITKNMSFCQSNTPEFMCGFDLYQRFVTSRLVDLFGKDDYGNICDT